MMKFWEKSNSAVGKRPKKAMLPYLPHEDALVVSLIPDILAVAGAVCITRGVALIYPPAGWVVAGAMCIIAAVVISKGSDDG